MIFCDVFGRVVWMVAVNWPTINLHSSKVSKPPSLTSQDKAVIQTLTDACSSVLKLLLNGCTMCQPKKILFTIVLINKLQHLCPLENIFSSFWKTLRLYIMM